MKKILGLGISLLICNLSFAQEKAPVVLPYNHENIRMIYMDSANHHTTFKPILHIDTSALYRKDSTDTRKRSLVHRKLFNEHLLEFRHADYNVFVDFLPDFQVGKAKEGSRTTWLNTRGVSFQANIGKKFYIESSFFENQGQFPAYLDSFGRKNGVVPGQGGIRGYNNDKAFDYNYATALISYTPNQYLNVTAGYGQNFIGDGYRSLLLSDIGTSYPYLKITGTLGSVQYTSIWAQFMDRHHKNWTTPYTNLGWYKKWGAFHFLDWNVSKKLSIGLFDAVIWPDTDSAGNKRGFDWSYMNPVIFLRSAEFAQGSSDNALVGMNVKFKIRPKTMLYGQLMLDEFKLKEVTGGNGWWANKHAGQLGIRAFDAFKLSRLDLQGEFNIVRPFTYSYSSTMINYEHYNQPLAHPQGANFYEFLGIATYKLKRWYGRGEINYTVYGEDPSKEINLGHDIAKSYSLRFREHGNWIGQGLKTNLLYAQGTLAYVLNPKNNLRIETSLAARRLSNDLNKSTDLIFSIGLRSTFRQFYYDF